MKRIILSVTLLLASLASYADSYKVFDKKTVVSQKGIVGLYETEGKVYLEMPLELLGKRFLMGTMVEACSDPLESSVGYQPILPYTVCFDKTPTSLLLCRLNESYVPCEGRNLDRSNISSVIRSFKILEYSADSTACLVDATSYFIADDASVDPIDPKAFNAAEGYVKRTGSHVSSSSLFKGFKAGNDSFSVSVSNSYKVKAAFLGVFSSSEQSIFTSQVRRTFVLLPQDRMEPLESNVKVGTYSVQLEEYDEGKTGSSEKSYAARWRLETDDTGTVKNPVNFYIDPSFPDSWRPYVYESVEEWNKVFEKVGCRSALAAMDYPSDDPEFDPSDIRYNCIRYNLSPAERITDSKWCDPSTGEILGAGIVVNHGISEGIKKNLILQTGAGNPGSRSLSVDPALFGRALKAALLRHVGHCLGLADNMAGSFAFPVDSLTRTGFTREYGIATSVMDELPFNFIAYSSPDVEDGTVMIQDRPGIYDVQAISWLYGDRQDADNLPLYGKRQRPVDFYDPRSMSFDLGNDAVASVEKGFEGLSAVISGLNEWIDEEDSDYNFRSGLQEAVVLQAYEYIKQVFVNVGGIYLTPKFGSDAHETYVSVPKDVQRRHMLWALERIDDLSFLDSEQLLASSNLRGDTGEFCQKYFTNFIFIQIDAMWLSEVKSSDPYTQEEALADVASHIWKGAEKGLDPTDLQKFQRNTYVENLLSWSGVRGNYYFREKTTSREASRPDKSHIWYGFLKDTKKLLEKACSKAASPEAKDHYSYLLFKIEQFI